MFLYSSSAIWQDLLFSSESSHLCNLDLTAFPMPNFQKVLVVQNGTPYRDKKDFRRSLITFATVSDALTTSNDFFVGIAPIFATIATSRAGQMFEAQTFCSDVKKQFGLTVPVEVAEHFVSRLSKVGLLERRGTEDVVLFWKAQGASDDDFHKELDSKLDEIIQLFRTFTATSNSIFAAGYDEPKLEAILFDFLVSRDKRVSAATSVLYGVKSNDDGTQFESEEEFICARFLELLEASHPTLFALVGDISNAAILSEVILELGEGRTSRDRKTELIVYVDTPLAMDAIGLSGSVYKDYAVAIITNLKKIGVTVSIFDHSVEEIRDNLHGLLKADPSNRKGPTADAIRTGIVDIAFAASAKNNIEEFVEKTGIQISYKPDKTLSVQQRSRFTDDDEKFLYQKLHPHYENMKALDRDILSMKLVVAKRDGATSTDIFRTKHLMMTRNSLLRSISRELMDKHKQTPYQRVPPAEHVSKVAAGLWLELGPSERIDISRKQLVSACSRVAAVRPEIIDKLHSTLQRILPNKAEQFATMMGNPHYMRVAMDSVAGSEKFITNKTAIEAFDRLAEEMVSAEKIKAKEKQKQAAKKHKEELSDKQLELQSLAMKLEQQAIKRKKQADVLSLPIIRAHIFWGKFASVTWIVLAVIATGILSLVVPSQFEGFAKFLSYAIALVVGVGSAYGVHKKLLFDWFKARGEQIVFQKLREAELLEADEVIEFDYSKETPSVVLKVDTIIDGSTLADGRMKRLL